MHSEQVPWAKYGYLQWNCGLVELSWSDGGDLSSKMDHEAKIPHHVVIDPCYIHGLPEAYVRVGVELNGAHMAVIDSHCSEIHERGADNQSVVV